LGLQTISRSRSQSIGYSHVVTPPTLSHRALNRATLARQMLLERKSLDPVRATERLLAIQAQEPRPPFLALWTRLKGFRREALDAALKRRDVVRATAMRATLHLMQRADYLAFRTPMQAALDRGLGGVRDRTGDTDMAAVLAEAGRFFATGPQTFEALRSHLTSSFPRADERAIAYGVRLQVPLVQIPETSRWSYAPGGTFTTAVAWLNEPPGTESAPHALALRYLAALGPATVADLQSWTGLPALRAAVDELRPRLRTFRDPNGRELFDLPRAPRPAEDVSAPVRFLPEFDNLILGHADRARVIADAHRPRLRTKNLRVPATFLVDGTVAGLWRIERKGVKARLLAEPFARIQRSVHEELEKEGEALLRFAEEDAQSFDVELVKPA
jgi:hypothetical protein